MTDNEDNWLPSLILFEDYNGNWDEYLAAIYEAFKLDFIDNKPKLGATRLGLKRHPISEGKEATFWHMTSEGYSEADRTPDFRRCERICWPRAIIENAERDDVLLWRNRRGRSERICLWVKSEDYLVILEDRGNYILPWTAYLVTKPHQQRKLQREYDAYLEYLAQKG